MTMTTSRIDAVTHARRLGIAPTRGGQSTLQAQGMGGHSLVSTASAGLFEDSFSRVSSPRRALGLQDTSQSLSAGLRSASGMSAGLHRSSMGIIHNGD